MVALTTAVMSLPGCGYALEGRGDFIPAYIKTIGVPQLINHSTVAGLDVALTDQLRTEFVNRGRRTQPDVAGADAVLTATITSVTITPVAFTSTRQASKYAIIVIANVQFTDKHDDKVLWANPAVQVRDEYDATTGTTANDPNAFLAGDANAMLRLSRTFAQQIVTSILEAF